MVKELDHDLGGYKIKSADYMDCYCWPSPALEGFHSRIWVTIQSIHVKGGQPDLGVEQNYCLMHVDFRVSSSDGHWATAGAASAVDLSSLSQG